MSLKLCVLKEEFTSIKYNGLVKLISQFPHLACLKVTIFFTWTEADKVPEKNPISNINIKCLFEEVPQLNDVELDSSDTITTSISQSIIKLLKQVKYLHLHINNIIADETVLEEEFVVIFEDFYYNKGNDDNSSRGYKYYYYDDSDYEEGSVDATIHYSVADIAV
ncbi:hypothetical protein BDF21DRAFT_468043 [Thamnidium elegans]|nr:hypothetical protein BDF21DRAFT_468043 [Thamnidium elegans]